jgi:hypothetical protein
LPTTPKRSDAYDLRVMVSNESQQDEWQRRRLRFPAKCVECAIALSQGAEAFWNSTTKAVMCLACKPGATIEGGPPGASAAAEGARRVDLRVEQVRRRYGDHAAVVAEQLTAKQADATWGKGSAGESRLAAWIAKEVGDHVIALHDRLIPGTRGNIDHLFVAPSGVWVVDAKAYKGKVVRKQVGPFWRGDNEVFVGGRNRTKLAKGVEHQLDAVIAAVRSDPSLAALGIYGALCFLDSDWGLMDSPFNVGNVWVTYPRALRKALRKKGEVSRATMEHVARRLDLSLPSAAPK